MKMETSKTAKTTLQIKDKIQLIEDYNNGMRQSELSKKYRVSVPTVSRVLKNKNKIHQVVNANKKRVRQSDHPQLEEPLKRWFDQMREGNAIVNGPKLLEKAKQLAAQLEDNFEPTRSWIQRWSRRNGIFFSKLKEESINCDTIILKSFLKSYMPEIQNSYSPDCIFNADGIGLYYKAFTDGICKKQEEYSDKGDAPANRFTLLFISNLTGTFKKLYSILKKPHCVPLPYFCNENACMTREIWSIILKDLNEYFIKQEKQVCMIVDNADCYKLNEKFSNIKIEFLPPNVTTKTHLLDHGIIHCFEVAYRKVLKTKQIAALEQNIGIEEFLQSISVLDALTNVKEAWDSLISKSKTNCFRNVDHNQSDLFNDSDATVDSTSEIRLIQERDVESQNNNCDDNTAYSKSESEILSALKCEIMSSDDEKEASVSSKTNNEILLNIKREVTSSDDEKEEDQVSSVSSKPNNEILLNIKREVTSSDDEKEEDQVFSVSSKTADKILSTMKCEVMSSDNEKGEQVSSMSSKSCDEILSNVNCKLKSLDDDDASTSISKQNQLTKEVLSSIAVIENYCNACSIDSTRMSLHNIKALILKHSQHLKDKKMIHF